VFKPNEFQNSKLQSMSVLLSTICIISSKVLHADPELGTLDQYKAGGKKSAPEDC